MQGKSGTTKAGRNYRLVILTVFLIVLALSFSTSTSPKSQPLSEPRRVHSESTQKQTTSVGEEEPAHNPPDRPSIQPATAGHHLEEAEEVAQKEAEAEHSSSTPSLSSKQSSTLKEREEKAEVADEPRPRKRPRFAVATYAPESTLLDTLYPKGSKQHNRWLRLLEVTKEARSMYCQLHQCDVLTAKNEDIPPTIIEAAKKAFLAAQPAGEKENKDDNKSNASRDEREILRQLHQSVFLLPPVARLYGFLRKNLYKYEGGILWVDPLVLMTNLWKSPEDFLPFESEMHDHAWWMSVKAGGKKLKDVNPLNLPDLDLPPPRGEDPFSPTPRRYPLRLGPSVVAGWNTDHGPATEVMMFSYYTAAGPSFFLEKVFPSLNEGILQWIAENADRRGQENAGGLLSSLPTSHTPVDASSDVFKVWLRKVFEDTVDSSAAKESSSQMLRDLATNPTASSRSLGEHQAASLLPPPVYFTGSRVLSAVHPRMMPLSREGTSESERSHQYVWSRGDFSLLSPLTCLQPLVINAEGHALAEVCVQLLETEYMKEVRSQWESNFAGEGVDSTVDLDVEFYPPELKNEEE